MNLQNVHNSGNHSFNSMNSEIYGDIELSIELN